MYRHHLVERPSSPPPLGDPNCSYPWHPPPSSTQHQASPSEPSSVNGSPTPTQQQMFISSNNQTYQPFPVHHHYHTQVPPRPKLSTTLWEDEGTLCYQVDAKGICVARRQGKLHGRSSVPRPGIRLFVNLSTHRFGFSFPFTSCSFYPFHLIPPLHVRLCEKKNFFLL
jgi:hypothetical protein